MTLTGSLFIKIGDGMFTKRFVGLLAFSLFFLGGCSFQNILSDDLVMLVNNPGSVSSAAEYAYPKVDTLRLPLGEDTLNPYEMKTDANINLAPLVYDSLTKLTPGFGYELCIASQIKREGAYVTVTLKDDLVFSDGSALTAADVQYSFRQAQASGGYYFRGLSSVASFAVLSPNQVAFTLSEADVFFPNLLTFPIIKNGSAAAPVGSGRYKAQAEDTLVPNPLWYRYSAMQIQTIQLVPQPDRETSYYSMKVGALDYMYTEAAEAAVEAGNSVYYVPSANLIFIGINDQKAYLSQTAFRQFLARAIDRAGLVEQSYFDRAEVSATPFPQMVAHSAPEAFVVPDENELAESLALFGLDKRDEERYIIVGNKRVTLEILVNNENETRLSLARALADRLEKLGFSVRLTQAGYADYTARVAAGNYDLFVGEVKLKNNLDLTGMLAQLTLSSGENQQFLESYRQFRQGAMAMEDFLSAFDAATPFIPLGYRQGVLYYSRQLYYTLNPTSQDIFYNMEQWQ